jgi:hypothetical protein
MAGDAALGGLPSFEKMFPDAARIGRGGGVGEFGVG